MHSRIQLNSHRYAPPTLENSLPPNTTIVPSSVTAYLLANWTEITNSFDTNADNFNTPIYSTTDWSVAITANSFADSLVSSVSSESFDNLYWGYGGDCGGYWNGGITRYYGTAEKTWCIFGGCASGWTEYACDAGINTAYCYIDLWNPYYSYTNYHCYRFRNASYNIYNRYKLVDNNWTIQQTIRRDRNLSWGGFNGHYT